MQFLDSLSQSAFLPIQASLVIKQVYVNTGKLLYVFAISNRDSSEWYLHLHSPSKDSKGNSDQFKEKHMLKNWFKIWKYTFRYIELNFEFNAARIVIFLSLLRGSDKFQTWFALPLDNR